MRKILQDNEPYSYWSICNGLQRNLVSELTVKTIPTRNWSDTQIDLVVERDNLRKKSQLEVDRRIHYLWFHYLKLCMNLEKIGYCVQKKDSGRRVIEEIEVKVNNYIYIDWSLNSLYGMQFHVWYENPKHRLLFSEGGFKHGRRSRYHSLVKRYNVFVEYMNRKTGNYEMDMQLCEDIIKVYQKEKFEQLEINHPHSKNLSMFNTLVQKDVKDCEKTILAVCEGRFPK